MVVRNKPLNPHASVDERSPLFGPDGIFPLVDSHGNRSREIRSRPSHDRLVGLSHFLLLPARAGLWMLETT